MKCARLTMDTDYHDLTWIGKGEQSDLERLFDHMAEAGFHATTWDTFWCGTATYRSRMLPVFRNAAGWDTAYRLAAILQEWDPLALALQLGKERGI